MINKIQLNLPNEPFHPYELFEVFFFTASIDAGTYHKVYLDKNNILYFENKNIETAVINFFQGSSWDAWDIVSIDRTVKIVALRERQVKIKSVKYVDSFTKKELFYG